MNEYMREGGINMWVMLITAVAVVAIAATRRGEARPRVLSGGCVLLMLEGMFGLSTGMMAISRKYSAFPDPTAAIAGGLGELANNGTFSACLALALGVASVVARHRVAAARA
jgi:hypothetical protein